MAIKTITVTVDAYQAIKRMKKGEESFSDLFLRLGGRPLMIKDVIGVLKQTPEEAEAFRRRVLDAGQRLNESLQKGVADVRARLKRHH